MLIRECSHIRRIDGQLNGLQLPRKVSPLGSPGLHSASDGTPESSEPPDRELEGVDLSRLVRLQASIKTVSTACSLRAILDPPAIIAILQRAKMLGATDNPIPARETSDDWSTQEQDLEWLLISKVTNQVYGLVLKLLLDQTIPLSNDIAYWDEVLGSYKYIALYMVQTSPLQLWGRARDIYCDVRHRLQNNDDTSNEHPRQAYSALDRWVQFYGLVKDSIRKQSLVDVRSKLMSPLTISQVEAKSKRRHLKRLREMSASGLGILVDEGMMFDSGDEDSVTSKARSDEKEEWKSVVSKSVFLMETVLCNIPFLELGEHISFLKSLSLVRIWGIGVLPHYFKMVTESLLVYYPWHYALTVL